MEETAAVEELTGDSEQKRFIEDDSSKVEDTNEMVESEKGASIPSTPVIGVAPEGGQGEKIAPNKDENTGSRDDNAISVWSFNV